MLFTIERSGGSKDRLSFLLPVAIKENIVLLQHVTLAVDIEIYLWYWM